MGSIHYVFLHGGASLDLSCYSEKQSLTCRMEWFQLVFAKRASFSIIIIQVENSASINSHADYNTVMRHKIPIGARHPLIAREWFATTKRRMCHHHLGHFYTFALKDCEWLLPCNLLGIGN